MKTSGEILAAIGEEPSLMMEETTTDGQNGTEFRLGRTSHKDGNGDSYSVTSMDVMSSAEITMAGKDSVGLLPPHDDLVAHAETLLWEADKILVASKRKKEDALIHSLVAQINGRDTTLSPANNPRTMTRQGGTLPVGSTTTTTMSPDDDTGNTHTLYEKPALNPQQGRPSKKSFHQHYILLVEANDGTFNCKIPTAREPGQVQMVDIYPFACALWANGCLAESDLPNDMVYAKLEVFLYNDSPECDFVPQDEALKASGRNHFSCTIVKTNSNTKTRQIMVPQTPQEQKPYLCLIMALLRRLRKKAIIK